MVSWVMNGLAGLGTLTPETSCNGSCYWKTGSMNRGVGETLYLRVTSATHTLHVKERKSPSLKKSTRSVARQAKDNGREEYRRMEIKRGKGSA